MIRSFRSGDMETVISIWLEASSQSHNFLDPAYWQSKVSDMRSIYIPNSETYVYERDGEISGFISLQDNRIEALFVSPQNQGKGIGTALMEHTKLRKNKLVLSVYQENTRSIMFYRKNGFAEIEKQIDEQTGHMEIVMSWQR